MNARGWLVLAAVAACAPSSRAQVAPDPQAASIPAGLGTLGQEDVATRLRSPGMEIRFLPLNEELLRLLAPDAYASLHRLLDTMQPAVDSAAAASGGPGPGRILVTFFALRPDTRFDPTLAGITIRGQFHRPVAVVPYSAGFSAQQLDVRGQASAIYLFATDIPVFEPFTVSYGTASSEEWRRRLPVLQRELARVQSKARQERPDTTAAR